MKQDLESIHQKLVTVKCSLKAVLSSDMSNELGDVVSILELISERCAEATDELENFVRNMPDK